MAAAALASAAWAASALGRSNLSSFLPSRWVSAAVSTGPLGVWKSAAMVQYSWDLNASISDSRWQISRSATDWTRPAEREPGSLRHSTGDKVKPTR